jgi:hypothetical protein
MLAVQRAHQGVGLGGDGVAFGRIGQPGPDLGELQRSGETRHQLRGEPDPFDEAKLHDFAAAELGSTISEDSSMASNCEAGTVFSSPIRLSGQAASWVPLKNQLLPLSARISP